GTFSHTRAVGLHRLPPFHFSTFSPFHRRIYMSAPTKTVDQNKAIFGLAANLGMEIDDIRDLAEDVTGGRTRSLKEISFQEANAMIVRMGGEAFPVSPAAPRRTVNHR